MGVAFLPDGKMLVTERPGRLRVVSKDGKQMSEPVTGLPAVDANRRGPVVARTIRTASLSGKAGGRTTTSGHRARTWPRMKKINIDELQRAAHHMRRPISLVRNATRCAITL